VPELLEVEAYRRAADRIVGATVVDVECPDPRYLRRTVGAEELVAALVGDRIVGADRHGKVLLLRTEGCRTLAVRFGMTGRLVVAGSSPIPELHYGPAGDPDAPVRFLLRTGGGPLSVVDPRRLGSVELDPDLTLLGPDAASLRVADLRPALRSTRALKVVLLDQRSVAGLGNLLVDESLWRAGLAPDRPADSLSGPDQVRLARTIVRTVALLGRRGGSHTGDLQDARDARGACPRCGATLSVATIGGRTTVWCAVEQA